MLENWNLARKYTKICSFRKNTIQYQGCLNFADVCIFLQGTFTQSKSEQAVSEIF